MPRSGRLDFRRLGLSGLFGLAGFEPGQVFNADWIEEGALRFPKQIHRLPDFRPADVDEGIRFLNGIPPNYAKLAEFEPLRGPFGDPQSRANTWVQSFEFLRDLPSDRGDISRILSIWLDDWLTSTDRSVSESLAALAGQGPEGSKSKRMIAKSRRVLNWLAHLFVHLPSFSPDLRQRLWLRFVSDVAKISKPREDLWSVISLRNTPISQRALWLRACAVLGVEAAVPGLLQKSITEMALTQIDSLVQPDGVFLDGSTLSTISIGADLAMLSRVVEIDPILQRVRGALATLRRDDASFVSMGESSARYRELHAAVLGPGQWRRSSVMKTSQVATASASSVNIWVSAHPISPFFGPRIEVEAHGEVLFQCLPESMSALKFPGPVAFSSPQIRRRDELDCCVIEGKIAFTLEGYSYTCVRTIRLDADGRRIHGEDAVFGATSGKAIPPFELQFTVPRLCRPEVSRDYKSVLLVTLQQQGWRLRSDAMDIQVKSLSSADAEGSVTARQSMIMLRPKDSGMASVSVVNWEMQAED